ncbi:hypothetical protein ACWC4D_26450 [Streptomyces sp. NPDC001288]|uniref:hypothetical protein n=1 Tax=Streptomyces sp. NPDC001297 TaxID=3364559 RepID=UPI0036A973E6
MDNNDDTSRATSGLTSEDLARSSGATEGTPETAEGASGRAPMYPGESVATPQTRVPASAVGADRAAARPDAPAAATEATRVPDTSDDEAPRLLTEDEDLGFRDRWHKIQNNFVDDPREAVHGADALVADVMQTLATTFAQHESAARTAHLELRVTPGVQAYSFTFG